ncbi:MAG TPA: hypothetical protein VI006_12660 [Solirubrobacteraceae bacterium]
MGLLDDAIREHLELKRQHGADPEELSRQEREALGAARKAEFAKRADGEAPEAAEPAEAPEAAAEPVDSGEAAEPVAEEAEPVDTGEETEPFDVEALESPAPAADEVPTPPEPEAAKPGYDEDPWLADERDEVPADESLDRPRAPESESADPEGEDVLEETPDFLQETPEHDRLWFEQRPPRDFDWDK